VDWVCHRLAMPDDERPMVVTIARLQANDFTADLVLHTARTICHRYGKDRLAMLWELCAVAYSYGRADSQHEMWLRAQLR